MFNSTPFLPGLSSRLLGRQRRSKLDELRKGVGPHYSYKGEFTSLTFAGRATHDVVLRPLRSCVNIRIIVLQGDHLNLK